ncbi:MAG: hypothetical protein ACD_38C00015G0002 [uncultured bacterium]|nr:MAG: hypothetical protein ACD_38C00015G0002 [uncultured bacterium]
MTDQPKQPQTEEEEDSSAVQRIDSYDTDTATFQASAQMAATLGLMWLAPKAKEVNAFRIFTRDDFNKMLFDFESDDFSKILTSYKTVAPKYKKAKERRAKDHKKPEEITSAFGPFFKRKISFLEFEKKKQAIGLASKVHLRVNSIELKLKIQSAARIYELDGDHARLLRSGLKEWLEKNTHGDTDYYLRRKGRELAGKQKGLSWFERRNLERSKKKEIDEQFKKAGQQAVETHRDIIERAQTVVNNADRVYTEEELRSIYINNIINAPTATQPPTPVGAQPQTPQTVTQPALSPTVQPPPPISPRPVTPLVRLPTSISNLINIRQKVFSSVANRIASSAIGQTMKTAFGAITKSALSLGSKALGTVFKGALTALSGGVFGAALKALEIARNIPVLGSVVDVGLKGITTVAVGIILAIVVVFVFLFFAISSKLMEPIPYKTSAEAISVPAKETQKTEGMNWSEFEKSFLTTLDADRHNQMKK